MPGFSQAVIALRRTDELAGLIADKPERQERAVGTAERTAHAPWKALDAFEERRRTLRGGW